MTVRGQLDKVDVFLAITIDYLLMGSIGLCSIYYNVMAMYMYEINYITIENVVENPKSLPLAG